MAPPKANGSPTTRAPNGRFATRPAPLIELGLTGLRYWSGRLDEELLTELKTNEIRCKIYKEMGDNDPTIGALFNSICWLCRRVDWRVEASSDTDTRDEFIDECRQDMSHSWEDVMSEIVRGMLQYGWQWHEIVYKRRQAGSSQFTDGLIGWKKLPVRAQDTLFQWDFDPEGSVQAMIQIPPPDFKQRTIPIEKSLLFRTESIKNSPEGRSILRSAYRPWWFKRSIENIEGIGIERDLAGLPVLYAPAHLFATDATTSDKLILEQLKKIATTIKRDEQDGIVMPMAYDEQGHPLYELKLLTSGGSREFDTTAVIDRYTLRILQLCLADFIQLGHNQIGSFALSSSKTKFFSIAIGVFLDQIQTVFNRFAIPRLLELNGMALADPPRLQHGDVETRDLAELANYLSVLKGSGMPLWPNQRIEEELLSIGQLPIPTAEERVARDQAMADQQAAALAAQRPVQPTAPVPAPASGNGGATPAYPAVPANKHLDPLIVKVEPQITITNAAAPQPTMHTTVAASPTPHVTVQASEPQHITITAPVIPAPQVTVDGSTVTVAPVVVPAPDVHVAAPQVTVEAAAPVVVPAPVVHAPVTVHAAAAPNVDVHVAAAESPVVKVDVAAPNVTVNQDAPVVNLDVQPLVQAIGDAAEKLKRPDKLTVERNPDGTVRELKAEG